MNNKQIKAIWEALSNRFPECGEVINYICNACEDTAEEYNAVLLDFLNRGKVKRAYLWNICNAWESLAFDGSFIDALAEINASREYVRLSSEAFEGLATYGSVEELREIANADLLENGIGAPCLAWLPQLPTLDVFCVVEKDGAISAFDDEGTALLNLLGRERLAEALANGLERLSNVEVA